jgi:hypothetical protein
MKECNVSENMSLNELEGKRKQPKGRDFHEN